MGSKQDLTPPPQSDRRADCQAGREDRLKAALKANMARRKAQARAKAEAPGAGGPQAGETDDG